MINVFVLRKWTALLLVSLFTVIGFYIGIRFYGFWIGLACMGGCLLVSSLLGNLLLRNPFRSMIEGKGILALNLDSTGIITPFIVNVRSPFIFGKIFGKNVNDTFDRSAVLNLAAPKKNSTPAESDGKGGIVIKLDEKEYNEGRFQLFHYPCLLWNAQIGSILTKDFLSEGEKDAFAEHGVLYLNRKMEELTSAVRDFGRYVVETIKPKSNIFGSKWFWIIIVIFLVIMAVLFLPKIWQAVVGSAPAAKTAVDVASAGQVVTPR